MRAPAWMYHLLLMYLLPVLVMACTPEGDVPHSGAPDSGLDAGHADSGMRDAGERDGSMIRRDGGALDAQLPSDSGPDGAVVSDSGHMGCVGEPLCADVTGDGCVDEADYRYVGENYGTPPDVDPACDLNGDGVVNTLDINIVVQTWGEGC